MTFNPHKHLKHPYSQIPHAGTRPIRVDTRHPRKKGFSDFLLVKFEIPAGEKFAYKILKLKLNEIV